MSQVGTWHSRRESLFGCLVVLTGAMSNLSAHAPAGAPPATARLREVCEQIAGGYDVRALLAVHRIGTLRIGDVAVVVGVAAAHRDAAFGASRALIDTLKAEVPIWKHQRFADGTDEWVAACLPAGDRPAS